MSRFHWHLVMLILALILAGCSQEPVSEPFKAPPKEMEGALEMDAGTLATITLRGLPDPILSVEDDAGRMWVVVSGGLENVGVGVRVLLEGGGKGVRPEAIGSYSWSLDTPEGSTASLDDPASRTPIFIPDVAGLYQANLTIANQAGVEGLPASLGIHAGTWVGNGSAAGGSDDPHQCIE
ncbi:MAG: hypothetical protein JXA42_18485, partial [Anaerolineales bacterium]|nr:hypothetical protein [Anaerolineales bacterium]